MAHIQTWRARVAGREKQNGGISFTFFGGIFRYGGFFLQSGGIFFPPTPCVLRNAPQLKSAQGGLTTCAVDKSSIDNYIAQIIYYKVT